MGVIACAIRGGVECKLTIERAVALTHESGLLIHFLYVIDPRFLLLAEMTCAEDIAGVLHEMGESVLSAAQSAALAHGVEATGSIRTGEVRDEIVAGCRDLAAEYLVLGAPSPNRTDNGLAMLSIPEIKARAVQETGACVLVPDAVQS